MKKLLFILLLCSPAFGQFQQKPMLGQQINWSNPLSKGLVAFWLFNEGSGNKVFDLSGNGNTGTLTGTAPSWSAGKFGSAVLLPGTNEYIRVADSAALDNKRTIIIWFKPTGGYDSSEGTSERLFTHRTSGGLFEGCYIELRQADGKLRFIDDPGAAALVTLDSVRTSWNDEWYMVALTADGTNITMYINGVYEASTAFSSAFTNASSALRFGTNRNASASFFGGQLDLPSIYNRALSASEIALLYREPFGIFEKDDIALIASVTAPPAPGGQFIMINMAAMSFLPFIIILFLYLICSVRRREIGK